MTWLLLTGAGLVVETVVIVGLARTVTARDDPENMGSPRADPTVPGTRDGRSGLLDEDAGALAERADAVRASI